LKTKPVIYSVVNLAIAAWVLGFLRTGGWLTHHYEWNDPNTINFVLMLLEPIIILAVIAYWIWRSPQFYRALFISFIFQLLVAAGFVALFAFFFLTWKPRLM
jgi:heme/copper-type cytochrome/quinol oxidase subunit 4